MFNYSALFWVNELDVYKRYQTSSGAVEFLFCLFFFRGNLKQTLAFLG